MKKFLVFNMLRIISKPVDCVCLYREAAAFLGKV